VLLLAPVWAGTASALDPGRRITQYVHDSWTSRDGMPAGTITAITQTSPASIQSAS
jgi:hypothetical protein